MIYDEYRNKDKRCFQIIVEDAAEEFQKVQDLVLAKTFVSQLKELSSSTVAEDEEVKMEFAAMPDKITTSVEVKSL
jgi:hypothetical protein